MVPEPSCCTFASCISLGKAFRASVTDSRLARHLPRRAAAELDAEVESVEDERHEAGGDDDHPKSRTSDDATS